MGIAVSLLLIAAGAILVWGVTGEAEGIDVDAVGVILMLIGLLGFVLTLIFWSSWLGAGAWRRSSYVEGDPYARRRSWGPRGRRAVVEEEEVAPPGPPPDAPPPP